jgi:hypothetical protein
MSNGLNTSEWAGGRAGSGTLHVAPPPHSLRWSPETVGAGRFVS